MHRRRNFSCGLRPEHLRAVLVHLRDHSCGMNTLPTSSCARGRQGQMSPFTCSRSLCHERLQAHDQALGGRETRPGASKTVLFRHICQTKCISLSFPVVR